jgi:hypothetical protein
MNITTGDILNYNATLWIAQDFILRNTTVDSRYLRVAKSRAKDATGKSWAHETIQDKCYFLYASLPNQYRDQLPAIDALHTYAMLLNTKRCKRLHNRRQSFMRQKITSKSKVYPTLKVRFLRN